MNQNNLKLLQKKFKLYGGLGSVDFNPNFQKSIALVSLNNVESKNALSPKMMAELSEIVDSLENTSHDKNYPLTALILTGNKKTFCSGFDLRMTSSDNKFKGKEFANEMTHLMNDTLRKFSKLSLISIAAIDGWAIGGGAELITACDFRCLSKNAKIKFVHSEMGVTTGWGGSGRLISILNQKEALKILVSGKTLTANDCLQNGLADVVSEESSYGSLTDTVSINPVIKKSLDFLNDFIFVDKENSIMRSSSSIKSFKKIISSFSEEKPFIKFNEIERDAFVSLWGENDQLMALERKIKIKNAGENKKY
ncbi:enoyl CoA hydratase domain-containing protein 1 [Lobulomyces angularis]|nr:enoyl CoA hydratase domain-containing protein 1 [Lobulomyces angularis]